MCQNPLKNNYSKHFDQARTIMYQTGKTQSDFSMLVKDIMTDLYKEILSGLSGTYTSDEICVQVQLQKHLIKNYFLFIRDILKDFVPNRINHKLINFIIKKFYKQLKTDVLIPFINIPPSKRMLVEEEGVAEERQRTELLLNAVNRAFKCLDEI